MILAKTLSPNKVMPTGRQQFSGDTVLFLKVLFIFLILRERPQAGGAAEGDGEADSAEQGTWDPRILNLSRRQTLHPLGHPSAPHRLSYEPGNQALRVSKKSVAPRPQ